MQLVLEVFGKCLYNQCEWRGILLDSIFLSFVKIGIKSFVAVMTLRESLTQSYH